MKKLFTLIAATFITVSLFTSCNDYWDNDPDYYEAWDLDGIWQGYISNDYYTYRYGSYANWYTEIEFVQTYAYGGTGTEYDYNSSSRTYQYDTFTWTVEDGAIYISYRNSGYVNVIADYDLYNGYFTGNFYAYETGNYLASFTLEKISGWTYYDYYDGWYDWDYYAKKNNIVTPQDSAMRADSIVIKSKVSENK